MKNRMRELRSCGSVRGGGSDAPAYSERLQSTQGGGLLNALHEGS